MLVAQPQWTPGPRQIEFRPTGQTKFVICDYTIEILFKALKSGLGFAKMLQERKLSRARVEVTIYLMLIFSVLFLLGGYQYWSQRLARVSLLKYAQWLRLYFEQMLEAASWAVFLDSVRRHCLYERRRKRQNFYELMLSP
ncbi:MAG: hypothetical protein V3U27_01650 [Candidatus Tectomicrobia bacterium]